MAEKFGVPYFRRYDGYNSYVDVPLAILPNADRVLRAVDKVAGRTVRVQSVLEVGAATGRVLQQFERRGYRTLGVEISSWARERALPGAQILWGPWLKVSHYLGDESFDLVLDSTAEYEPNRTVGRSLAELWRATRVVLAVEHSDADDCHDKNIVYRQPESWKKLLGRLQPSPKHVSLVKFNHRCTQRGVTWVLSRWFWFCYRR